MLNHFKSFWGIFRMILVFTRLHRDGFSQENQLQRPQLLRRETAPRYRDFRPLENTVGATCMDATPELVWRPKNRKSGKMVEIGKI